MGQEFSLLFSFTSVDRVLRKKRQKRPSCLPTQEDSPRTICFVTFENSIQKQSYLFAMHASEVWQNNYLFAAHNMNKNSY